MNVRNVLLRSGRAMLIVALSLSPNYAIGDDENAVNGPFAEAIVSAQLRTVKVYGAGIGRIEGYASGLIVSDDGEILTTQGAHLSGYRVRVTLPDGTTHEAQVVRRSDNLQLALLKIAAETPHFFEVSEELVGRKGDWIVALSNAFKVADGPELMSANLGIICLRTQLEARRGTQDYDYTGDMILIDAITSNPGAPGGAVVAADGRLVGMIGKVIESKSTNTRLNYAVPCDILHMFLAGEEPVVADTAPQKKAVLGIRLFTLGGRKSPAYIDRVLRGSPAFKARLRPDDLVVAVAGQRVDTIDDYDEIVDTLIPGEEISLVIKRQQDVIEVQITPEAEEE